MHTPFSHFTPLPACSPNAVFYQSETFFEQAAGVTKSDATISFFASGNSERFHEWWVQGPDNSDGAVVVFAPPPD